MGSLWRFFTGFFQIRFCFCFTAIFETWGIHFRTLGVLDGIRFRHCFRTIFRILAEFLRDLSGFPLGFFEITGRSSPIQSKDFRTVPTSHFRPIFEDPRGILIGILFKVLDGRGEGRLDCVTKEVNQRRTLNWLSLRPELAQLDGNAMVSRNSFTILFKTLGRIFDGFTSFSVTSSTSSTPLSFKCQSIGSLDSTLTWLTNWVDTWHNY